MDDDKLQKGLPPIAVRIVAMGELTVYMVSEDDLSAIERGSPSTTMATLANSLLCLGGGFVGSLLLSGPPQSIYNFSVFTILTSVCFIVGLVLLILSRRYKEDRDDVIKRIRSRASVPTGPQITAQSAVVDIVDEESH